MNPILMWMAQNKLATILGGVVLATGILLGVQTMRLKVTKVNLEVAEKKVEAKDLALKNLQSLAKVQEGKIEKSAKRIKSITRQYEKYIADMRSTPVPADCAGAVDWGVDEANKLIGGTQ